MEWNKSESVNELAAALAKAQQEIKGAMKDSVNPFFKSKYADLESVWDACREPLTKNGLSVVQIPIGGKEGVSVQTILLHSSGQWIAGELLLNPTKTDPQAIGLAISYGRRYSLAAFAGVYQTDDDGNAASGKADAVEADQGPECADCKRKVANYKRPGSNEVVPWKHVVIKSREDYGLNICAGCQIARRKAENSKKSEHSDVAAEIVEVGEGEYAVQGVVTGIFPGNPFAIKCGEALFQIWHKNSLVPHFKESKGKRIDVFCKKSNGFYCIERINSIGKQKFVDNKPATDLEATTVV
jgi:hypothetical protein